MSNSAEKIILFWFRRDLRLTDNRGLAAALDNELNARVLPVYCLDKKLIDGTHSSANRNQFLVESLLELQQSLRTMGSDLLVVDAEALDFFREMLLNNSQITGIYFNRDYTSYSTKRDKSLAEELENKVDVRSFKDEVIFEGLEVAKADGQPYTIFTPYKRAWLNKSAESPAELAVLDLRKSLKTNLINRPIEKSIEIPAKFERVDLKLFAQKFTLNPALDQHGGSNSAIKRLSWFVDSGAIYNYAINRNRVDLDGTSKLSAHLKFGTISIRQAFQASFEAFSKTHKSVEMWQNELIWREFYQMILANFPQVEKGPFKSPFQSHYQNKFANISWSENVDHLQAWSTGRTGYPFIDASIRQLLDTGWMHNRGRMAVAMFLTKDLHINWQTGEKFFMKHLVDGDTAANNGGWQWSAGTGTDAAPYFRIFNPVLQGQKADPEGKFVSAWIPELKGLQGSKFIHSPWQASPMELASAGILLGKDYPLPIVDHNQERLVALSSFEK